MRKRIGKLRVTYNNQRVTIHTWCNLLQWFQSPIYFLYLKVPVRTWYRWVEMIILGNLLRHVRWCSNKGQYYSSTLKVHLHQTLHVHLQKYKWINRFTECFRRGKTKTGYGSPVDSWFNFLMEIRIILRYLVLTLFFILMSL